MSEEAIKRETRDRPSAYQFRIPFLYHYQKLELQHLEDLLKCQHLHGSNLGNLNDPWDCRPAFDEGGLVNREQRILACSWLEGDRAEGNILKNSSAMKFREEMYQSVDFARKAVRSISTDFPAFIKKRWIVYCVTPNPSSTLMWSHYADNHKGICLEFSGVNNRLFASAFQVDYRHVYPSWPLHLIDNDVLQILLTKSSDWSYENEYRIVGRLHSGPLDELDGGLLLAKDGFLKLPPGGLVSIIVGCESPNYNEIKELVGCYMPGLAVKRMVRVPNHFQLEIEG